MTSTDILIPLQFEINHYLSINTNKIYNNILYVRLDISHNLLNYHNLPLDKKRKIKREDNYGCFDKATLKRKKKED